MDNFQAEWNAQRLAWENWLAPSNRPQLGGDLDRILLLSETVLKTHEDRTYRGALVASLSVPWGDASESRGGYHLVWSRDLVQSAGALIAMGAYHSARDVLRYLIATQMGNGRWHQNQWLGGKSFWGGVQLDEIAFPVLLAAALADRNELDDIPIRPMIVRALRSLVGDGPVTAEDRWEENTGINMFTLAVVIAALVEGSAFLDEPAKSFVLTLADYWNARLEDWAFVKDTPLAQHLNISGYFVRTMPADIFSNRDAQAEVISVKNRTHDPDLPASAQVSTDFLQLVRYGLRQSDDIAIRDSIKAADALLKVETPNGAAWRRYNGDGYGEHHDGSPFNGTGHGRAWPLLVGERGHYALCAGEDVLPYLNGMAAMSGRLGLIPEQVWDSAPIAQHDLSPGKPSGSAMPLVWAHGEFVKLCFSRGLGHPIDRPAATWNRYQGTRPSIDYCIWQPQAPISRLPAGDRLLIVLPAPARIHWGVDGWNTIQDSETRDTGLGMQMAELDVRALPAGSTIQFSLFWTDSQSWDGRDYTITVCAAKPTA
jgi:glucoamylase